MVRLFVVLLCVMLEGLAFNAQAQTDYVKVGEVTDDGAVLVVAENILKSGFEAGLNDGTTMISVRLKDTLGIYSLQGWGRLNDTISITASVTLVDSIDNAGTMSLYVKTVGSYAACCCKNWDCQLCRNCEVDWSEEDLQGRKKFEGCLCYLTGEGPCIRFCDKCECYFALTGFITEVSSWL